MRTQRGFTLVEVLVALMVMAVIATLAWRGMDGILRSRDVAQEGTDRVLRMQSVLAQWQADLDAITPVSVLQAPRFNGASLTLARRSADGLQIVVWALRGQAWQRWASPATTRTQELEQALQRAEQLLGNEPQQLTMATGLSGWRVFYYRGNTWSNAQSSAGTTTASSAAASAPTGAATRSVSADVMPVGIRLELDFDGSRGWDGKLVRDLRLSPK